MFALLKTPTCSTWLFLPQGLKAAKQLGNSPGTMMPVCRPAALWFRIQLPQDYDPLLRTNAIQWLMHDDLQDAKLRISGDLCKIRKVEQHDQYMSIVVVGLP